LKIKRTTYLRALKASVMSKKPSPGDMELERYLERVTEDDNDVDAMLVSYSILRLVEVRLGKDLLGVVLL
jgi:hypothetical protein